MCTVYLFCAQCVLARCNALQFAMSVCVCVSRAPGNQSDTTPPLFFIPTAPDPTDPFYDYVGHGQCADLYRKAPTHYRIFVSQVESSVGCGIRSGVRRFFTRQAAPVHGTAFAMLHHNDALVRYCRP